MARITGRRLGLIDRLFLFSAGKQTAPEEYSVESPIQPVHDLGRMAEIASPYGLPAMPGYYWLPVEHVHVGADDMASTIDPRVAIAAASLALPEPFDVWLMPGVTAWSNDTGAMSAAVGTVWYPLVPGQGTLTRSPRCVLFCSAFGAGSNAAGAVGGTIGTTNLQQEVAPFFIPPNTLFAARTVSLGASTTQVVFPVWVGSQGSRPPGIA